MIELDEEKFYITAAIAYVNAAPHIGHAFEFTQTDVIKRFNKILGCDTLLLTGADENSLKNVQAAEKLKISTQQLCDKNTPLFYSLVKKMNISCDVFIRSSDKIVHWPGVFELWKSCLAAGDLYKKNYKGLYCVACELFYTEDELEGGLCPVHNTKPDLVEEENYFFRLSKYQDQLKKLIETDELRIVPVTRKNEILSFINSGLEDFSVSRSVQRAKGWGVPVPDDPSQIMYVWFDALCCYMTGIGFGSDQKKYEKWWPADVHVIGKDIIRFHAVYWPAILLSAKLKLPKNILSHGFLTVEGKKMSKTTGNVVDPVAMIDKYGVDALRYYFIREIPTFQDGDFSEATLKDRYNKELLGDIGNLVSRALTLVEKSGLTTFTGENVLEKNLDLKKMKESFDNFDIHWTLEHIMEFVRSCNKYVNDTAPWKLEGKELEQVLYNLLEALRISSILLWPFIPETAESIAKKLGTQITSTMDCKFRPSFTEKVTKGEHLFKKIE